MYIYLLPLHSTTSHYILLRSENTEKRTGIKSKFVVVKYNSWTCQSPTSWNFKLVPQHNFQWRFTLLLIYPLGSYPTFTQDVTLQFVREKPAETDKGYRALYRGPLKAFYYYIY